MKIERLDAEIDASKPWVLAFLFRDNDGDVEWHLSLHMTRQGAYVAAANLDRHSASFIMVFNLSDFAEGK